MKQVCEGQAPDERASKISILRSAIQQERSELLKGGELGTFLFICKHRVSTNADWIN